ncbi:hypothetical protein [Mesorhizobium sp. M0571]|uniref:hypothetical protein n=1 Tax=Mesorhizobium sp. M0571 TaxID=2956960 RepID=UPI003336D9D5
MIDALARFVAYIGFDVALTAAGPISKARKPARIVPPATIFAHKGTSTMALAIPATVVPILLIAMVAHAPSGVY